MSLGHKRETNNGNRLLNSYGESGVTDMVHGAHATRGKRVKKEVDEEEAILQLIRMVLMYRRVSSMISPITIESVKRLKKLLGIESLATKEGKVFWQIREGLGLRLEGIGVDRETGVCVDREKFRIGVKGIGQEEANRLEEKFRGQDKEARSEALRESLQRWRPTKKPVVASVGHYLSNQVLNERIAREIRAKMERD